ncbi:MAG: hypothetical protein AABW68_04520 [archaeon]
MLKKPLSFRDAVNAFLSPSERGEMIYSFDALGDMALIEIPPSLQKKKNRIARTLLDTVSSIHRVYEKVGVHSGKYRVEKTRWLAGVKNPVALSKEWGCSFLVDPGKVFFNPRLGTERQRVASSIRKGQSVCVFFAGVGPYPIILAKHTPLSRVYALEWNPSAKAFAEENILLNKVGEKVIPIWGDVESIPVREECDHIILPAPETASSHVSAALQWCKVGGLLHFYTFVPASRGPIEWKGIIRSIIPPHVKWSLAFSRKVRAFSSTTQQWCVGIRILSKGKGTIKKNKKKVSA